MPFAGSAIAQNAGRIDQLDSWKPTWLKNPRWLLIAGSTDPPKHVDISDRRNRDVQGERNGNFLFGVTRDLVNMEDTVGSELYNTVKNLYMRRSEAVGHIKRFFDHCQRNRFKPMLYYSGHGEVGTGDWCFDDGTIGIQEIVDILPAGSYYPMIFSDACYSGHWANFCTDKDIGGFLCLAASPEFSTALDIRGKGGELTLYMTGNADKLPGGRPKVEPIYSGGTREDYPITNGYDKVRYVDFVSSHLLNSDNMLISQSLNKARFTGVFGPHKRYKNKSSSWGQRSTYGDLIQYIKTQWKEGKNIVSLVVDDETESYYVYMVAGYGYGQTIVKALSSVKKEWDDGKMITSCNSHGSIYYIVMTDKVDGYHGKGQTYFSRSSWSDIDSEIGKHYQDGKIITSICYNQGLKEYLVVMTTISAGQSYMWTKDSSERSKWMDEMYEEKDYHPTIVFKDPNDDQILVVMTSDDQRSGYTTRFNYQLQ